MRDVFSIRLRIKYGGNYEHKTLLLTIFFLNLPVYLLHMILNHIISREVYTTKKLYKLFVFALMQ